MHSGVTSKTRKRNIVIPEDPGSFADAVIQIVQDASTGGSIESELEAAGKLRHPVVFIVGQHAGGIPALHDIKHNEVLTKIVMLCSHGCFEL